MCRSINFFTEICRIWIGAVTHLSCDVGCHPPYGPLNDWDHVFSCFSGLILMDGKSHYVEPLSDTENEHLVYTPDSVKRKKTTWGRQELSVKESPKFIIYPTSTYKTKLWELVSELIGRCLGFKDGVSIKLYPRLFACSTGRYYQVAVSFLYVRVHVAGVLKPFCRNVPLKH